MENMCEKASHGKVTPCNLQVHGYFILKAKSPTWQDLQIYSFFILKAKSPGYYLLHNLYSDLIQATKILCQVSTQRVVYAGERSGQP